jgi:hypothetical protein
MRSPHEGRTVEQAERRILSARISGRWAPWQYRDLPDGVPNGSGWSKEFRRLAFNGAFAVMWRKVETEWGEVTHAMVSARVGGMPTWGELQRIKDGLFGRESLAVNVHPRHSQLVDGADASHLWILPAGMDLPFGLHAEPG